MLDTKLPKPEYTIPTPPPPEKSENKWIRCKDEMPERHKSVLVYDEVNGCVVATRGTNFPFRIDVKWWSVPKRNQLYHVTHWMPLPDKPKPYPIPHCPICGSIMKDWEDR